MAMVARGYDASWSPPDPQCMKNAGYAFACRYSSSDPTKNLSKAELDKLMSLGMSVCIVHQDGKTQTSRGYSGGQADARAADSFANGLGLTGIPLYFSCDQDFEIMTPDQKALVDAYFDGVKSVIGKARAGGYGDDSFCKRQLDAGRITYAWQCRSWSEGMWEPRAQLRQVKYDFACCGGTIDDDEAWASDHGQWPRPAGAAGAAGSRYTAGVAFDSSGRPWHAGVWDGNGQVNVKIGDGYWTAADPGQSGARGGAGIAYDPAGDRMRVTYVNAEGALCCYTTAVSPVSWSWAKLGGTF
jgi:Rv2525c-like, glycoside hydrolase-like domain